MLHLFTFLTAVVSRHYNMQMYQDDMVHVKHDNDGRFVTVTRLELENNMLSVLLLSKCLVWEYCLFSSAGTLVSTLHVWTHSLPHTH